MPILPHHLLCCWALLQGWLYNINNIYGNLPSEVPKVEKDTGRGLWCPEAMAVTWGLAASPCTCSSASGFGRRQPAALAPLGATQRASVWLQGCKAAQKPARRRSGAGITAMQQPMLAPRCVRHWTAATAKVLV